MITRECFIKAIEYMIQSPFVRKMVNSNRNNESEIAKKINDSAYKVADIVKELGSAKEVIVSARNENAEEFSQIASNYILESRIGEKERKAAVAQKEYDDFPKIDPEYVSWREAEESKINDKTKQEITKIKKDTDEEKRKLKENFLEDGRTKEKVWEAVIRLLAVMIVISLFFVIRYISVVDEIICLMSIIIVAFCIGGIVHYRNLINAFKEAQQSGNFPETIVQKLELIDKEAEENKKKIFKQEECEIAKIREEGVDYRKGSEFDLMIKKANAIRLERQAEMLREKERMSDFKFILDDFFVSAPDLLQRTIDNVNSLCTWANNYLQNKRLEEHYDELAAIERDKVRIQESMKRTQEKALKEQNEQLREQTKAMQARARAEEERAKQAAELTDETREIRRKMDDENYGNRRRPL